MNPLNIGGIVAVVALVAAVGVLPAPNSQLKVDNDGVQCPGAYPTIQAAVDVAQLKPGKQKIRICEGTYTENVLIGAGNSVEIKGDGVSKVTIYPATSTPGPVIEALDAGTVDIEQVTIDGNSQMTGNPLGIRYQQTSGKIRNVAVLNIRDASGGAQGTGIRINSLTGAPAKVSVEDSLVKNWTRVGVMGNGTGVELRIEDVNIVGPDTPKVWAPNGVQISRGAKGDVRDNTISGAAIGIEPPNAGSGILLFCAGPTKIRNNSITDSDTGVNHEDSADSHISNNVVRNSAYDAYPILSGVATFFSLTDPFPVGCPQGIVRSDNNQFRNNTAIKSARDGIHMESFAAAPGATNNRIQSNTISDSTRDGIRIVHGIGNNIAENIMASSTEHDAHDDVVPTPNTWRNNICRSVNKENQPGLCFKATPGKNDDDDGKKTGTSTPPKPHNNDEDDNDNEGMLDKLKLLQMLKSL